MKKNILNDKVIRAMAIGISAMLATATPMSVMAADGDGIDDDANKENSNVGQELENASDVQKAGETAAESVDTANESVDKVKSDVEANVEEGEIKDSKGNDLASPIIDAASLVENKTDEDGSSVDKAADSVALANGQVDAAEVKAESSDTEYENAQNAAEDAAKIASDVKDAMNVANEKADQQVQNIENATTVADANAAYDELAATADQAQKDFDDKLADYNAAKDAYDAAAAKVAEYEEAYNKAIENADANAAAAQAELEAAQANAAALEAAVRAAKDAVGASAKGAMEIAAAEDLTRGDGVLNWGNQDVLFKSIMENYYLPEIEKIKGAKVTRVRGKDNNEYNYFKVEYNDADGNPQVKYYNYKMDNGSTDDIVIFEKREVEVDYEKASVDNPDQYVKDTDNKMTVAVDDVAAGVKDGTIVNVDGKYVEKNNMTGSETLVSNSEITKTSTKDVTVDSTKHESWEYDAETGELVKTVTADVTTITYTGATFKSNESYATDAERDKAAEAKKAELEEATGKDATINETENTTYTYTASGTYIPTFTKTVTVKNQEVEWDHTGKWYDDGVKTKEEAYEEVKNDVVDNLQNVHQDWYIVDTNYDLKQTGTTKGTVLDDPDFLISGTVTATYAKVTKTTISQSTFGSLWNDIKALFGSGQATNEKLEATAKAAVEAEGGIFVGANWDDLIFNKATIRYVAGVKVTTGEGQTEQAAKDAVQGTALEQAKANGATGVYNVKTTGTNDIAHTTYSYTVKYLEKATENTETGQVVATETYGNAVGLTGQIIQNKNYYDTINGIANNILLTQKDTDYRTFVDDAKAITGKYNRLWEEAQQANADVLAAQEQVDALQEAINDLKGKSNNKAALTELAEKLDIALANRNAAEGTLKDILQKLEDAGVARDEVIARLTPPSPTGGDGGETGGAPSGTTTVTGTPVTTAAVQSTGVTATVATTTVGTGAVAQTGVPAGGAAVVAAAGNQEEVTIADEQTPLAVNTEENNEEDTTVISDEETPLAAEAMEEKAQQEKMSWWWLLIIAILGATGYEMYRKHQEKKKAAVETKSEK